MAHAMKANQPFTKSIDKSAIRKMAQRPQGFRVNAVDISQRGLVDMALQLVQERVIYQADRMGDIVVYRMEEGA